MGGRDVDAYIPIDAQGTSETEPLFQGPKLELAIGLILRILASLFCLGGAREI